MKTLKDFTPEVKAKIPEYIDRALKGVFDGGRYKGFDLKKAQDCVYNIYTKCGYKKPVVIIAGNPYEQQIIFNYVQNNPEIITAIYFNYCIQNGIEINIPKQLRSQLDSQLDSQLRSQLHSQLYSQLRSQLDSQLYSQLRSQLDSQLHSQLYSQLRSQLDSQLDSQLRSQLDSQLRSQLYSQLYSQLRSQLDSQLDSQLRSQLDSQLDSQLRSQLDSQLDSQLRSQLHSQLYSQLRSQLYSQLRSQKLKYHESYLYGLNIHTNTYFTWYNFMAKELKIEAKITPNLELYSSLYEQSGIYNAIVSELLCVVSKYPKKVIRDNNQRLHNPSGPAVEWESICKQTNFENYYIHGRSLPQWIWDNNAKNEITREMFLNETNEEIKAGIYEVMGQRKMMDLLGANLIDEKNILHANNENEIVQLYKTKEVFKEIDNNPFAWVKVICPSTGTNYLLGVEPHHTNAKTALASLSQLSEKEYSFNFRA